VAIWSACISLLVSFFSGSGLFLMKVFTGGTITKGLASLTTYLTSLLRSAFNGFASFALLSLPVGGFGTSFFAFSFGFSFSSGFGSAFVLAAVDTFLACGLLAGWAVRTGASLFSL
jgi:hypothetical protein